MERDGTTTDFETLRAELQSHGIELGADHLDADGAAAVTAALGLPNAIASLYTRSGPGPSSSIPWVVEELFLYSLGELPSAQEGYRWSGLEQRMLSNWRPDWVVIASSSGDPFFMDVAEPEAPVFFARHGADTWHAKQVAPTLPKFIGALAAFEAVLLGDFDSHVWTEAGPRVEFIQAVETRLAQQLAGADLQGFMSAIAE